jgi:hypothetical protein
VAGYVVVLPSQASAQAGGGGDQKVFYLQLDAGTRKNGGEAVSDQLPGLFSTLRLKLSEDSHTVFDNPVGSKSAGQLDAPDGEEVQPQAEEYQKEIKESTPAVIKKMRKRPLLLWDEKSPGASINLSDSGVSN